MVNRQDFQTELDRIFSNISKLQLSFVDLKAGDLHHIAGDYPGSKHRMPICCDVMYKNMSPDDTVLEKPPKGKGANLIILYKLPR
jgi:hypothetical protein